MDISPAVGGERARQKSRASLGFAKKFFLASALLFLGLALVGFGRPTERPWAENGMLAVRTVVTMTLAGDHRVSNGHRGGVFLNAIARRIQKPETL